MLVKGVASGFAHGPRLYQSFDQVPHVTLRQQKRALYPGGFGYDPALYHQQSLAQERFDVKDRFTGRGGRR